VGLALQHFCKGVGAMDITNEAGALRGATDRALAAKQLCQDVTVRSVDSVSAIRTLRSHQRVGIAAATGEQVKLRHYSETLCNQTQALVCLAVESHGRWGKQLKRLVTQYVAHSVAVHGQGSPADRASMQAGKEVGARQVFSVGLQRAYALSEQNFKQLLRKHSDIMLGGDRSVREGVWDLGEGFLDENYSFAVSSGGITGVEVEVRVNQVAAEAVTDAGSARLPVIERATIAV